MPKTFACKDPRCDGTEFNSPVKLGNHNRLQHPEKVAAQKQKPPVEPRLPSVKCPQALLDEIQRDADTSGSRIGDLILNAVADHYGFVRTPVTKVVGHTWTRR